MSLPRFLQLSTLTTFPASLLNRDDSGLAKRLPFGPCTRTRVSSQCLKRHWRLADDPFALRKAMDGMECAVRSRRIFLERIEKPLQEEGLDRAAVEKASDELQKWLYGGKDSSGDGRVRSEVVVLGEPEIRFLREKLRERIALAPPQPDKWWKDQREELTALTWGAGVDAAMFGRFVSGEAEARVSAAVHVAHAFTVHAEASETDYFTATDDLQELGSGHINAAELASGIFYCYVVIDVPQLVSNLCGLPAADWLQADREAPAAVVRNFTRLLCTVSPGAKLGSTAPYARAWLVLAEAGESQPRTLADAFLTPVPAQGDMRLAAAQALAKTLENYDKMYGQETDRYLACLPQVGDIPVPGAQRLSLPDVAETLARRVREGA
ncbi:MAG: type I-E CRISPR-associated protein Cas7/Cse4/CasC [Desulfovibrio sp.]|jgi:CRISPR system Cascade subunit CasC|nr:type I-E CRISPR-associated protein Cas7/Cse4/CasC [Desulfovibrio sp.]